jgi:uncharacterized protein YndB with AHSA1/START domain
MKAENFTVAFTVPQSPEEVFAAVNDVRGWWSEGLVGKSAQVGDEFTYRHEDVHRSRHRVTEQVPGERVVWKTLEASLPGSKDPGEWTGTEIHFDITRKGKETELRFTHVGLVPSFDCFESCSRGWTYFVGSLKRLVTTGKGTPDPASAARGERAA